MDPVVSASLDLPDVTGWQVTQLVLDYRVTLLLAGDDDAGAAAFSCQVVLSSPFSLRTSEAATTINPGDGAGVERVVALLHTRITHLDIDDASTLTVVFSPGAQITAAPDLDDEAWEVDHTDGVRVIGTPGGELAIFPPRPPGDAGGRW